MRPLLTDDDVLPNLPPLDGDAADSPPSIEDADSGGDDGDESIGLDVSVADGLLDDADLFELEKGEGESWLRHDEASVDTGNDEDDLEADGGEDGWSAFADTDDESDDEDEEFGDEGSSSFVDRGEEGVEEEHAVQGDDDASDLAPMDLNAATGNEAADDLDLREAQELETATLSFEEERRWMGASLPPSWPAERISVRYLGVDDSTRPHVPGQDVTSFDTDPSDPKRIAVGTRLGGAYVSRDGGSSFERANAWSRSDEANVPVAFHVAVEARPLGTRLWGRSERGGLYRSEDFGRTWVGPLLLQPVMALAVDPLGGVVIVSVPKQGPAQLGRFVDNRWLMRNVARPPTFRDDLFVDVAAFGQCVAIAYDSDPAGTYVSRDGGETFASVDSLPSPTCVAFAEELDGISLYAALFFAGADRGVIVRRAADGTESLIFDVASAGYAHDAAATNEGESDRRIYGLRISRFGEETHLRVLTGVGVFLVVVK